METPPARLAASHALWERARRVMPGGIYGHKNGAAAVMAMLLFLAAGPQAAASLWGLALLLAIVDAGLFIESAAGVARRVAPHE